MQQQQHLHFGDMIRQFVNFQHTTDNISALKGLELTIDSFTKTKESWDIILQILATSPDPNVLSLASSLLKNKLQYDFGQLSEDQFQTVHQSLIEIIAKLQKPANAVRINLCVSVAIVYIHKAKELGHLLNYLSRQFSGSVNRNYVYTILEVLPEEVDNDKIVVDQDKRIQLREYFESIQKNVLVELNDIGKSGWESGEIRKSTLLKCFSNWIRIGADKDVIMNIHNHFLLEIAFENLANSDISEECSLCIQFVIRAIDNPQQFHEIYGYIAKKIVSFFGKIKAMLDDDCKEMCESMVKLICVFGICSKHQLATNRNNDYKEFVQNVALLTYVLELEYAVYMQQFWIEFLEEISHNQESAAFYKESLENLYLILSKIVTFQTSECEELNRQSSQELEKVNKDFETKLVHRFQFKALFNLLAQVMVPESCLILSLKTINQLPTTDTAYWAKMESFLNPLEQVIDKLSEPTVYLNSLISKLVEIDPPYQTLRKTIIRVLSSSSKIYSKNTEFAEKIFQYLIEHMKNPEVNRIASRAFENLCVYNTAFVLSNIKVFISILLVYRDNEQILNGIIKAIEKNQATFEEYMPKIFSLYTTRLTSSSSVKEAKAILDKVILLFKKMTQGGDLQSYSHVMSQCFKSIWIIIKPILEKQCITYDDETLLEKCTKVIKYGMRCLKKYFQPYVEEIFSVVVEGYRRDPKSSYVYVFEVLVTVYSDNPDFLPYISTLFEKISEITFGYMSSIEQVMELPRLGEDFFGLLTRILRLVPEVFFSSKHIQLIIKLIVECCGIEDGDIGRVFYGLLLDLFMQYWSRELVEQFVKAEESPDKIKIKQSQELIQSLLRVKPFIISQCQLLIQRMFSHLETGPSTTIRVCIVNALTAEIKAFTSEHIQIWMKVLRELKEDILTESEKQKMLGAVVVESEQNMDYAEDMIYLMTKRYLHRLTRSPI